MMPEAHLCYLHALINDLVGINCSLVALKVHLVAIFSILDPFSASLLSFNNIEKPL